MQPDNVANVVARTHSIHLTACVVVAAKLLGLLWEGNAPLAFDKDCIKAYEPTEAESGNWPTVEEIIDACNNVCMRCEIPTGNELSTAEAQQIIQTLLFAAAPQDQEESPPSLGRMLIAMEKDEAPEGQNEDAVETHALRRCCHR